jgi:hypothetical protein
MKIDLLFTLFISISAILLGYDSNWLLFLGKWGEPDMLNGLIVTVIFLVALLIYGIVKGYTKKKGFLRFISLYWGISGSIGLIAILMAPIGKFALIVLPIDILTIVPTLGLKYFFTTSSNNDTQYLVPLVSMISSWSAGALGYLLGFLLKKFNIERFGINA